MNPWLNAIITLAALMGIIVIISRALSPPEPTEEEDETPPPSPTGLYPPPYQYTSDLNRGQNPGKGRGEDVPGLFAALQYCENRLRYENNVNARGKLIDLRAAVRERLYAAGYDIPVQSGVYKDPTNNKQEGDDDEDDEDHDDWT